MDDPRDEMRTDRLRTLDRVRSLNRELDGIVEATSLVATDDEHDPEGASTAFERQQVSALLAQARRHLSELDAAVVRIDDGSYGTCERCGAAIAVERLRVRPAARTCIRCASTTRDQEAR